MLNDGDEQSPELAEAHAHGRRYHRVCAAVRAELGNDAVGDLYRAWGERLWYEPGEGDLMDRLATAAERIDVGELLETLRIPAHLADAADDPSWDDVLRIETGPGVRATNRQPCSAQRSGRL